MSLSRGNWSALSRLAKQRSEDDEEEQIRERRRRNRISSNPGEKVIEVLTEEGNSDTSLLSSVSAHSTEETEKKEQTEKHQSFKALEIVTVSEIGENQELRSDEEKRKLQRDQNFEVKKQTNEINKVTVGDNSEECHCQQNSQGSNNQAKVSLVCGSQKEVSQGPNQQNKLIVNFEKSNHKINENQESENGRVQREAKKANDTKKTIGQDIPDSSPSSSSISTIHTDVATDIYPSSESVPANDYGTSSSTKRTETHRSQVFVSTVKIPRKQSTSDKDDRHLSETNLPVQNKTRDETPSATKTIKRTEMHIAALPSRSNSNKEDDLPLSPPRSSQFRRFSPRTSSFRAMSQSEDKGDGAFSRNSSLRFSLRSRNIEDRMEKYVSAVQRSGSVCISKTQSRCITGASDGIASKLSIFEKDDNPTNKAPSTTKKDLTLPVAVTSRINQWASKTQEDSTAAARPMEISIGHVSNKNFLWQQKSQLSSDTKL